MKSNHKFIIGIGASISLGLAAIAVSAHPGPIDKMGQGTERGATHHSAKSGMGHDAMRHGAAGQDGAAPQAAQQLLTPEERTAMLEKMLTVRTPEERQQIALANRAELEKRAKEKGITLPEQRGHRGRHGTGSAAAATPSATTGHAH